MEKIGRFLHPKNSGHDNFSDLDLDNSQKQGDKALTL